MASEKTGHKKIALRCLLLLATAMILLCGPSCKKIIQQKEKNIIIDAMTNGHWYVEQYKQDSTDITTRFTGYEFQFYENGNVDGIKNTVLNSSGTWSSDINNYTITANFPATANDTLKLLNYTWKITDSYLDYVEANTSAATGKNILHLRKK
jgi:hypothetical protein